MKEQTCRFCEDPDSILTPETCCTGCSKLHKCEIPGWKCYGNGPIYLETGCGLQQQVNYCPFCGTSEMLEKLTNF